MDNIVRAKRDRITGRHVGLPLEFFNSATFLLSQVKVWMCNINFFFSWRYHSLSYGVHMFIPIDNWHRIATHMSVWNVPTQPQLLYISRGPHYTCCRPKPELWMRGRGPYMYLGRNHALSSICQANEGSVHRTRSQYNKSTTQNWIMSRLQC